MKLVCTCSKAIKQEKSIKERRMYEQKMTSIKKPRTLGDERGGNEVSEFWAVRLLAISSSDDKICFCKGMHNISDWQISKPKSARI